MEWRSEHIFFFRSPLPEFGCNWRRGLSCWVFRLSCHSSFSTHTLLLLLVTRSKSSSSTLERKFWKNQFFLTLCCFQFSRTGKSKTFVGHLTFKSCCCSNPNFWHMVHQVLGVNKILLTVNDKFFHTLTQCCCQAVVPKKLRQSWLLRI